MAATHLSLDALVAWIRGDPSAPLVAPGGTVIVDLDEHSGGAVPEIHAGISAVVVGTSSLADPAAHPAVAACDVATRASGDDLAAVTEHVARHPIAAVALATLLRGANRRDLEEGLVAESATYSALQDGHEFAAWLATHHRRERPIDADPVLLARDGAALTITLNRPHVRNALNVAMRDALIDAFDVVQADLTLTDVQLRGAGAAFCAGGDLDEFGTFKDSATAHVVRLERSVARSIASVAERVTAHLHGACAGSGIELPAFAGRVVAHPSTTIVLPELGLGLVPGAGGSVSLPRRIGRHRTALLGLGGQPIDASTALEWGLVDAIDEASG